MINEQEGINKRRSVWDHIKYAGAALENAGIPDAGFDARQLAAFVLGRERLRPTDHRLLLSPEQEELLESCIKRRIAHEPLQYILGEWEFMGLRFRVGPGVLIPRPDTETLCEAAQGLIRARGCRTLLDICTGSGCIGIALAASCGIDTTLADISPVCIRTAAENAKLNNVSCTVLESDLFEGIAGSFDMITANPPYIASAELPLLQEEVRHEPVLALDGGGDGLAFYRRIRGTFSDRLKPGGTLLLETGYGQARAVAEMFEGCGRLSIICDIEGRERVVLLEKKTAERP